MPLCDTPSIEALFQRRQEPSVFMLLHLWIPALRFICSRACSLLLSVLIIGRFWKSEYDSAQVEAKATAEAKVTNMQRRMR